MLRFEGHPLLDCKAEDAVTTPVIVRLTNFDIEAVGEFRASVESAIRSGQPLVPIIVSSDGGDAYGLCAVIDIIEWAKKFARVATIVDGKAFSSGAYAFASGSRGYRYVGASSTIMLHNISTAHAGKLSDAIVDIKETSRLSGLVLRGLDKNCGQSKGYFAGLMKERGETDWYITPSQAVRHGLADHIGTPSLVVGIDVSYSFG